MCILDTSAVADYLNGVEPTTTHIDVELVAAVASRLGGAIISSDADFDALPVPRENWRDKP